MDAQSSYCLVVFCWRPLGDSLQILHVILSVQEECRAPVNGIRKAAVYSMSPWNYHSPMSIKPEFQVGEKNLDFQKARNFLFLEHLPH